MNKNPRYHIREQDPKVRAHNFEEVALGFDHETMLLEADRCLGCKNAPCKKGCPVGVDIPEFISALKQDNPILAAEIIKKTNCLPAVCGRVCPQEEQCEKYCVRAKSGGAVSIGALERYSADSYLKSDIKNQITKPYRPYKVAVIGSGPSGLACAGELASNGISVTMYEAFHKMGGVLVYGIPEFRLPKSIVKQEINKLKDMGVEFKLNTVVGKTIIMSELREMYDCVFIGSGAGLPIFMNLPGENLNGVYSANEYLTRVNLMGAYKENSDTPLQIGKNVVVVGAGNVAMDSARTAIRMGAQKVYIVYRRSRQEMPARAEEIIHAEEEGIELVLLTSPIKILGSTKVEGIECLKMELGEPDASGRRKPIEIANSNFVINCNQIIMSIGTSPNPLIKDTTKGLNTTQKGTIIVSQDNLTSLENVYAGGDTVTGAATVILAMGAGKSAAKAIMEKLKCF